MIRRLSSMMIVCLLAGLCAVPALAQQTVRLEYKYTPGQILRYRLFVDMGLDASSTYAAGRIKKVPIQVEGVVKQQVKNVAANGDAEIQYSFESMKVGFNGKDMHDLAPDQMPATTMIVSKGGEVKAVQGAEGLGGPLAQLPFLNLENLSRYSSILPSAEVKVGDVWTKAVPFPERQGVTSKGSFKAEGKLTETNVKLGSHTTVALVQRMTGEVNLVMPMPPDQRRVGGPVTMDATSGVWTEATNYFSPEKGCMVYTKGDAELRMSSVLNGATKEETGTVNVLLKMQYKLKLLD